MATALTQAQNPGAKIGDINTSLASLGKQLTDAVNSASFNGLNILNGSQTALSFVSGYNASATGGTMNTIAFTASALYGLATSGGSTSTTSQSTVTDAATMAQLQTQWAADTADTTAVTAGTITATYGQAAIYEDTTNQAFTVQSLALDGTATTTTYTALDANGNSIAQGGTPTFADRRVLCGDDDGHHAGLAKPSRAERQRSDQLQHHRRELRRTAGLPRSTRRSPPSPTTPRRSARRRIG